MQRVLQMRFQVASGVDKCCQISYRQIGVALLLVQVRFQLQPQEITPQLQQGELSIFDISNCPVFKAHQCLLSCRWKRLAWLLC